MDKVCIVIVAVLLNIIIGSSGTDLVTQLTNKKPVTTNSYIFNDQELQNLAHQVQHLKDATENMRLKIEINTFSIKEEMAALRISLTEECSKYKQIHEQLPQEFAKLKSEIVEEIRGTFVERHYNLSDHLSQVTHSVESTILSTVSSNIKSEIEDLKKMLQSQINSLWTNAKNEISDSTNMKSEIGNFSDFLYTNEPEISTIANISQSIQTTVEGKLGTLENTLLPTEVSLTNFTKKSEFQRLPDSCAEALQNGGESGIYKLHLPSSSLEPFDVYCLKDPENGPAWTVVQRRQDGSTDFYRNWEEYKNGFGDLNAEFFIGLDRLHTLTSQLKLQELWIKLTDWEGASRSAKYSKIHVGHEDTYYFINLGEYSGDAGDSMMNHRKFSTHDSDNDDSYYQNCAKIHKGAWWFGWYGVCLLSNLNGEYLHGALPQNEDDIPFGIHWYHWRGEYYSYKYAHMAIRPIN